VLVFGLTGWRFNSSDRGKKKLM